MKNTLLSLTFLFLTAAFSITVFADETFILKYSGKPNLPGSGKNVVLVSGDEEYRSEETVVQFGRILSQHHGFNCTVLFAINPQTGFIDPLVLDNIPGLESLKTADVLVLALRYRNLPDEQMQYIDNYLKSGKPVFGIRTSTHAFAIPKDRKFAHYDLQYDGADSRWKQGFGRLVLGETWIKHHGKHGSEATRGVIALGQENNPLVRGCAANGSDIFGPTDVYEVRLPLPDDAVPVILGQVLETMDKDSKPVSGEKNNPMMPLAWTKSYKVTDDAPAGKTFCSTIGSSQDFQSEGVRRLLVNAVYYLAGLTDKISEKANVDIIGDFQPLPMGFGKIKKELKQLDFK
jgi:hypothetical protein